MEFNKFRTLTASEIDVRIATVKNDKVKGVSLLLYKNARVDQNILDEQIGALNWQRDHKELKGNIYCGIGIYNEKLQQWVWKWDAGAESFSDKEKGEASDSFKRAGFNWGIGRELYTTPFIWVDQNGANIVDSKRKDKFGNTIWTCYDNFVVEKINYDKDNIVNELVIKNTKLNKIVFNFKSGKQVKKEEVENKPTITWTWASGRYQGKTMLESAKEKDFDDYIQLLKDTNHFSKDIAEEYEKQKRFFAKKEIEEVDVNNLGLEPIKEKEI